MSSSNNDGMGGSRSIANNFYCIKIIKLNHMVLVDSICPYMDRFGDYINTFNNYWFYYSNKEI